MKFAMIGAGGYIAPRHIEAIKDLGGQLVAAYDPNDSVGILDRYFPDCRFFTKPDEFKKFIDTNPVSFVSVCSPNHFHLEHCLLGLNSGADVICEKPLVLREQDIETLLEAQKKTGKKVYTVLQLRVHEEILKLRKSVLAQPGRRHKVELVYITSRGPWYHESWKGDVKKSGGLSTNIGVHFFDMLTWIFGAETEVNVKEKTPTFESGVLKLEKADVTWSLSLDRHSLPAEMLKTGKTTFRSIRIDGVNFEFSEGFTELHKTVYRAILQGAGYGPEDSRPAIRIVEKIRNM